ENILNSVKGFGKKTLMKCLIPLMLVTPVKANGWLEIRNYVDSIIGTSPVEIQHYDDPGISDEYNASWDIDIILPTSNRCSIYSDISTHKLRRDTRLNLSINPFNIKLVYNGNLLENVLNSLEFNMPYGSDWSFDNKPIYFQQSDSSGNLFGPIHNVRDIIENNEGILPLDNVPAGTYNQFDPYGGGVLDIGGNHIPEPSTIALLSMGLPLLRRKRKHVESKVAGGQPAG
ncbi:MAG: PEP-CTERM sorting domain-containing protein, partial [Planctomycetes bacterium]|nr:PEP-CTERM sorting domain-containing protein [Planctomycetota bacterium]MBU1517711.1 PEP-CTERM sorting domain-containing protein [Planctomycetota bacterium]